jgi:hypothetical protein
MVSDEPDTIRAKVLKSLHRGGFYAPRGISIQGLASMAVATSDEKKAKELINEMARDDSTPIIYKDVGQAVMLETDSTDWVGDCIRRWDDDQLTWDLR